MGGTMNSRKVQHTSRMRLLQKKHIWAKLLVEYSLLRSAGTDELLPIQFSRQMFFLLLYFQQREAGIAYAKKDNKIHARFVYYCC